MKKLTFLECQESKKLIDKKVNHFSNMLNTFPTDSSGLIADIYRNAPEYNEYKKQFNFWFKQLQTLNKYIVKNYKKENRELSLKKRLTKK